MTSPTRRPATWRIVLAAIFDFVTAFFVFGYLVGWLTGGLNENGFRVEGVPALLVFAGIALYFFVFNRFLGGTIWKRVFGAVRPRETAPVAEGRERG